MLLENIFANVNTIQMQASQTYLQYTTNTSFGSDNNLNKFNILESESMEIVYVLL